MLSGVPSFVFPFGYVNSSWTLRVGLVGEYFGRLLCYVDANGRGIVTPVADAGMSARHSPPSPLGISNAPLPGWVQLL